MQQIRYWALVLRVKDWEKHKRAGFGDGTHSNYSTKEAAEKAREELLKEDLPEFAQYNDEIGLYPFSESYVEERVFTLYYDYSELRKEMDGFLEKFWGP